MFGGKGAILKLGRLHLRSKSIGILPMAKNKVTPQEKQARTYWYNFLKRKGMRGMVPNRAELARILNQFLYGINASLPENARKFLLTEYLKVIDRCSQKDNHLVYFIGNLSHKWVKIGYTKSLEKRLGDIQVGCPFPVDAIYTIESDAKNVRKLEKSLHTKFKNYRMNGEWFRLSEEIEQFIARR
jgi:hypothetical protein